MSKDALIRFRAPSALKRKLTALGKKRDQDLSEFLRQRCLDIVAEFERAHPDLRFVVGEGGEGSYEKIPVNSPADQEVEALRPHGEPPAGTGASGPTSQKTEPSPHR